MFEIKKNLANTYIPLSQKGAASGVVPLSASSKIITAYLNTSTTGVPTSTASVILNVADNLVVESWSVFLATNLNNYIRLATTNLFLKHDTTIQLNAPTVVVLTNLKFGGVGQSQYLYKSGNDLYWFNGTVHTKLN